MQRDPTLKLMVASKLPGAQQAARMVELQQQHDTQVVGRIPVQKQQPVLLQQREGTAPVLRGAPSSSLQPSSRKRHTRPAVKQVGLQQQQQQQQVHGAAATSQIVPWQHELPLPQQLQEKLQQQQVTLVPPKGTTAAAAAEGAAASAFLQALQLTGDESQPQQPSMGQAAQPQPSPQPQQPALSAAAMASAAGTAHEGLDAVDTTSSYIMQRGVAPTRLKYPLWWHGPMWSGSGYGGGEACWCSCWLHMGVCSVYVLVCNRSCICRAASYDVPAFLLYGGVPACCCFTCLSIRSSDSHACWIESAG